MSAQDRSEIARLAALKRWGKVIPFAIHEGTIVIGESHISCAVLEDKKRVLSQGTFLSSLGRARRAKGGTGSAGFSPGDLPPFLPENLRPFISDELLERAVPIEFQNGLGQRVYGYDALLLPLVCETYLDAAEAGKLRHNQRHIADQCKVLQRGFTRLGIIGLIDQATGYQDYRPADELQQILAAYIEQNLLPWVKRFPDEFFQQIYRLHGWAYRPGTARTPLIGHFINRYVYKELPPGVLEELRRRNPTLEKGYRRNKHHQLLTEETGVPHLDRQIAMVLTIMRLSDDEQDYEEKFNRAFGKAVQQRLPLIVDVGDTNDSLQPR
jgi:hypothetical protein